MKSLAFLFIAFMLSAYLTAQEKFTVPQLTPEQKTEVLYNHVIAYATTGISFAKSHGISPEEYGVFIGKKFSTYWNPDAGFPMLVNQMMFILAGMHPNNEMQIVKQDEKSITFKMKNVDLAFQNGPMFDVSYQDFLDCSFGIISVLARYMNSGFSHKMTEDGWYVATFSKEN
ncbi:MAG TPA: hypothetical protein VKA38_11490 [Draconibacterium sp.]|nr:hypothetical protein [Draconibacterium sp.]